jgi:aldehyde:ferredoxin oxidoreductase
VHGFFGRVLHVDLQRGTSALRPLEETRLRKYLGGIGLGTSLLFEYAPTEVDPLSPDNPLIFVSAPFVGTRLTTTAKFAIVTKSPLTGFIADSLSSSHFALALKRLGIDALIVTGRAPELSWLQVNGESAQVKPASALRGKSPRETESLIRSELAAPHACVAAIGVAGENQVRFATISNDGRHAGRGGGGAVMGAKNLKAVVLSGHVESSVADPERVNALALSLQRRSVGSVTDKYRKIGTVANLSVFNRLGTLPTRNFQGSTFEAADAVSGETLTEDYFSRRHGCVSCTIQCERLFKARSGVEQRLEYETLFALGPLCGVASAEAILDAARLCDDYGLDAISTGGTVAWALETATRGLLPAPVTEGLRFGSADSLVHAIHAIAHRDGFGALLAEGCRRAAQQTGHRSAEWAMHVKGLELPGYDPRSLKTMALGLAVSPRGACHNRSGAYDADFSGEVDRFRGDATRGALVARSENFAAVLDSLIVCKFLRKCFTDFYAEAADLLAAVTGWDYTAAEVEACGERIHTLKKLFNIREAWQPEDDWLPPRLVEEPVATGMASGVRLSAGELREMIRGYYRARSWDADGFVPPERVQALGID